MAKYSYHQVDSNAEALYAFLEAHGATVKRIGKPLDALVCYRGVTALIEVKTATGKLRPSQVKFLQAWPGFARVVRSDYECLLMLKAMAEQALKGSR